MKHRKVRLGRIRLRAIRVFLFGKGRMMKMLRTISIHGTVVWLFFGACLVTTAAGAPLYYAGTGHYYERVDGPAAIDWDAAKAAAEGRSHLGQGGYLATITSAHENGFIVANLLSGPGDIWIGGYQPENSPEPAGGWQWVTGEPWVWTNWHSGSEPNNSNGLENVITMKVLYGGRWNDAPHTTTYDSYMVEYTPEPATLSLLALGCLIALRRRRR